MQTPEGSREKYQLIADIGGTSARFALLSGQGQYAHQHTLLCSDYPDIVNAISTYLAKAGNPGIEEAAIAIANPVDGDVINMTNHYWEFSIEATRQALALKTLVFKNDLTALAMAIPLLSADDLTLVGGNTAERTRATPLAIVAPGTGLGVSGLINADNRWIPLDSEGGHVSLSPGTVRENAILEHCWNQYEHVSAERLVSGMGIQNLYRAICSLERVDCRDLSPAAISQLALSNTDDCCREALQTFCGLLGSVAGNLVLTLGAYNGVYIGGGIVPGLGDYFDTSPFRERFESKGRYRSRMESVPAYVITSSNPTLTGISQVFRK